MATIKPTKIDPETGKPARGTRWLLDYRDANKRHRTQTFARKADAEAARAALETDIRRNEWIDPRKADKSFKELADIWWATTTKLQPHTRRGYYVLLTVHVRPFFDEYRQASVDWLLVEKFIAQKLEAGHEPKRVRDMVSIVSLVMKVAVKAGIRRDNPASAHNIQVRRKKISHGHVLTMKQGRLLAKHTRDPYKPLIWVLLLGGLRPAELCGLRVEHVDFVRSEIHITETFNFVHGFDGQPAQNIRGAIKTDAGDRILPIPASLRDELSALLSARAERRGSPIVPDEPLFESIKGGKPLTTDSLRKRIVRPALVAAGLDEALRTYDTRHTHATLLIDGGANVLEVAQRMGHTDPAITLRVYGHLFEDTQRKLTDRLEAQWQEAGDDAEDEPTEAPVIDLVARRRGGKAG